MAVHQGGRGWEGRWARRICDSRVALHLHPGHILPGWGAWHPRDRIGVLGRFRSAAAQRPFSHYLVFRLIPTF